MKTKFSFNPIKATTEVILFFFYALASVLLTWPLTLHMSSMLFGDYGDARGEVWSLWAKTHGYFNGPTTNLIAAPFGVSTSLGFSQPVTDYSHYFLALLSNEVFAHNAIVLSAFPLTAMATYFLLDRLLKNKVAAFTGGLIFGFAPASVLQAAGGHSSLAFNLFVPLFVLSLFANRNKRTWFSALLVGLMFAAITSTAMYFGYFAIYVALFFVAFDFCISPLEERGKILKNLVWGAFFAISFELPFVYTRIFQQIGLSVNGTGKAAWRPFFELEIYSSRPWEYFVPSVYHPVFGDAILPFMREHLHGSNIPEQSLYLGLVPFGLLVVGIFFIFKRVFSDEKRIYFLFFSMAAFLMFFLSLPPLISIGRVSVPTMSYFLYLIAPMFRVYSRLGIFVNFFVACAAAVVIADIYQRIEKKRFYVGLAVLFPLLIFEYWSVPPNLSSIVDPPPAVYQWLAQRPGDFVIAEYPMMRFDELSFYTYLFWQRIHKKRMVNGIRDFEQGWDFFEQVNNLNDPQVPSRLRSVGVKYVIVHKNMYQQGPIPKVIQRDFGVGKLPETYNDGKLPDIPLSLKLVKAFGGDMVFELSQ